MNSSFFTGRDRWRKIVPVIAAGAFLAACSSNSTDSSSAPSGAGTPAAGGNSPSASAVANVMTHSGPLGTYLTDGAGRTLYLFATDTGSMSTCSGTCATNWPPLTTTEAPQAGDGVTASDLTTTTRSDGTKQVDYHGHPLYYYAADGAAGDTNGQGINNGGLWWVVAPNGTAITASAPATSGGSSSGGSGSAWS